MKPPTHYLAIALVLAAARPGPALAQLGGQTPAALKAKSQSLDNELGQEMRRLQHYLVYEDQILSMEVAQGSLDSKGAAARLAQAAAVLYRQSYTEADLQKKVAEHQQAAGGFFQKIERAIGQSENWPSDRAPADYKAMAAAELQKIRAGFGGQASNPDSLAPLLSHAAEVMGWTGGKAVLPASQNPFAGASERVISAITSEHGRFVAALPGDPRLARAPGAATAGNATVDFGQLLGAANNAFSQGKLPEARQLYEVAAKAMPASPEAWIGLARVQNATGDIDGAIKSYETVHKVAPDTPNLRTWLAELSIAKGDRASAQRLLDEELRAQPNSAWALSWLGSLQLEAGRRQESDQTFAKAAALDPRASSYRFQNGSMLLAQNQPRRAAMDFIAAVTMDPRGAGAYYQLGDCYARLGQKDWATQYYKRYLQSDGTSEWAQRARQQIALLQSP